MTEDKLLNTLKKEILDKFDNPTNHIMANWIISKIEEYHTTVAKSLREQVVFYKKQLMEDTKPFVEELQKENEVLRLRNERLKEEAIRQREKGVKRLKQVMDADKVRVIQIHNLVEATEANEALRLEIKELKKKHRMSERNWEVINKQSEEWECKYNHLLGDHGSSKRMGSLVSLLTKCEGDNIVLSKQRGELQSQLKAERQRVEEINKILSGSSMPHDSDLIFSAEGTARLIEEHYSIASTPVNVANHVVRQLKKIKNFLSEDTPQALPEKQQDWERPLKEHIIKQFGNECGDFKSGCPICIAWLSYYYLHSPDHPRVYWDSPNERFVLHPKQPLTAGGLTTANSNNDSSNSTFEEKTVVRDGSKNEKINDFFIL